MLAIGCGSVTISNADDDDDDDSVDAGTSDGEPSETGNPQSVSGSILIGWVNQAGMEERPSNATPADMAAIVPRSDGGFDVRPVSAIHSDGRFTVDGVPDGPYYLRYVNDFFYTTRRELDIGWTKIGRPTAGRITQPTPVTFNVTGLKSWQGDAIDFFSLSGARWMWMDEGDSAVNPPQDGDTSLSGFKVNFAEADFPYVVDSTMGDTALLYQAAIRTSSGDEGYIAMDRVLAIDSLSMVNGGSATISGAFTNLDDASNVSVSLTWARSRFEGFRAAVHPQAQRRFQQLAILAAPPGLNPSDEYNAATLLRLSRSAGNASDADMALGTVKYPPYFPPSWTVYCYAQHSHAITYQLPGAAATTHTLTGNMFADRVGNCVSKPIEPKLSPPRNVMINGASAVAGTAIEGAGLRPRVSWSPPGIGTPSGYVIIVYRLLASNGGTGFQTAGRVFTTETEVALPPGLLQAGQHYFFAVAAVTRGTGNDFAAAPFRGGLPFMEARAYTNRLTP
ncbi:MAG: fibronectin type III domain-containing protein [Kofleriaceae bacterium]